MNVIGIIIFFVGLLASIALHELGHLFPAKKFGVRIPQYMVGFGPTLWSKKTEEDETEYGVKLIPLGGYVRMIGMYPTVEEVQPVRGRFARIINSGRDSSSEELLPTDTNRVFYKLSAPKKLAVMFGGPVMNLIISAFLFSIVFCVIGTTQATTSIKQVIACVPTDANPSGMASTDGGCGDGEKTPAVAIGVKPGDQLVSVNGTEILVWDDLSDALAGKEGKEVQLTINRGGNDQTFAVTPATLIESDKSKRAFLGLSPEFELVRESPAYVPYVMKEMSGAALSGIVSYPASIWTMAKSMVSGQARDPEGPVSVIGISAISGQIASSDAPSSYRIAEFLSLLASVNLFLFLFNMVPVLPLDGGHIVGALYEGIKRTLYRLSRRPKPAPVDTARMLPLAYVMSMLLLASSVIVILADIIKPISF